MYFLQGQVDTIHPREFSGQPGSGFHVRVVDQYILPVYEQGRGVQHCDRDQHREAEAGDDRHRERAGCRYVQRPGH